MRKLTFRALVQIQSTASLTIMNYNADLPNYFLPLLSAMYCPIYVERNGEGQFTFLLPLLYINFWLPVKLHDKKNFNAAQYMTIASASAIP